MTETKVEYVTDNQRIDAMVAEKVMGWSSSLVSFGLGYVDGNGMTVVRNAESWEPTSDMNDAWLVVERMRELGWQVDMDFYPDEKPGCSLWKRGGQVDAYAEEDSMPLAICMASLKVLGVGVTA